MDLSAVGLTVRFGALAALNRVDLEVAAGERRAVIGPNGAGKTTLLNVIAGEHRPTEGSVRLGGRDATPLPPWQRARLGLGRTFQRSTLFSQLTVADNIALAVRARNRDGWRFWPGREDELNEEVSRRLEAGGIGHLAHRPAGRLGHGERRILEVELALAASPSALLLDEPMAGLSGDERQKTLGRLRSLPKEVTVVIVEHDIDAVTVAPGEAVALLGRNGAGKTTTLMAIAGAIRPSAGTVEIDGYAVAGQPSYRIARRGLSLVPQGRRIFTTLSVRENLTLASRGGDLAQVYSLFEVLASRSASAGSTLSGGEQQMLAIGRALMTRPRLLLMDEPSEGLAPQVVRTLADLVARLRREVGLSILIAEQNLALAFAVADRVYVMERGEVVHEGGVSAFRDDAALHRRYLGV